VNIFIIYHYIITAILCIFLINFIINNIVLKNTVKYGLPESFKKNPPLVSVMIPARNESENIKRCLRSLLKQDYPNLEILVLDDNSDDGTSISVKQLAENDERIRLIAGKRLKKGWLGKCYACWQLSKHAKGKYLIFTDADTLHSENSISCAIGCLISNRLDALSSIPRQIMVSIHERLLITWVQFGIMALLPLYLINKSRSPLFSTANGQFLLFKKEVYRKIGGHKSIKNKILEDIHISKMVKKHGYKFMIFDGSKNINCRMYRNLRDLRRGFSKFMFAAFDFKLFTMMIVILLIVVLFLMPFILLPVGILFFNWPGIIFNHIVLQICILLIMRILLAIKVRNRVFDSLLHPFSMIYVILICINSVFQTKFGEGVYWKGRSYDVYGEDSLELIDDDIHKELSG
jgi:chlorobactene glucosyltransferase